MSFFDPLPPSPPERPHVWAPPMWDRPSEGTLPAIVPVGEIVHRTDDLVVAVDHLRAYPNGFTIQLLIMRNPHLVGQRGVSTTMLGGAGDRPTDWRFPRVGVRFADGRTGGRGPANDGGVVPKDERGVPTEPIVRMTSGSGGSTVFRYGLWVFPVPPDGPLEVHVGVPGGGGAGAEGMAVIDGAAVRAAAERAQVVWG